jgi:hypothetical protein
MLHGRNGLTSVLGPEETAKPGILEDTGLRKGEADDGLLSHDLAIAVPSAPCFRRPAFAA